MPVLSTLILIFILSCFVGYFAILQVTPALYSPLMSFSNAISGIVIIGAITGYGSDFWNFIAVFLASINIFGGFAVSSRMLNMFEKKGTKK